MYSEDALYVIFPIKYKEAVDLAEAGRPVYFVDCSWSLNYVELDAVMLMTMPPDDDFGTSTCWSSGFSKVGFGEAVDVPAGEHIFTFCEPKEIEDLQDLVKRMWKFHNSRLAKK